MTTIIIDANLVRAAMASQAKKDVRYYLNGILLTTAGDVVGTDGHTLFHGKQEAEEGSDTLPRDIILSINGIIPLTAKTVTIELDNLTESPAEIARGMVKTDNGKIFTCETIDGKYPDFNRVIPERFGETYCNVIPINASYLARIEKVFGKNESVAIYHRGEYESIRIECPSMPGSVMVIMPVRMDSLADCFELFANPNLKEKAA